MSEPWCVPCLSTVVSPAALAAANCRSSAETPLAPQRLASTTDRTFVVRIRGGKAEWIDVTTGLAAGSLIEVFGDLAPGDEVAGRGTDEIRPGTEVRPRQSTPAT